MDQNTSEWYYCSQLYFICNFGVASDFSSRTIFHGRHFSQLVEGWTFGGAVSLSTLYTLIHFHRFLSRDNFSLHKIGDVKTFINVCLTSNFECRSSFFSNIFKIGNHVFFSFLWVCFFSVFSFEIQPSLVHFYFHSLDRNDWKCSIKSKELSTLSVERWDNITNPCRQKSGATRCYPSICSLSTCSHVTSNDTWFYLSNKGFLKLS